jgi:PAS domain S-box-containing protein
MEKTNDVLGITNAKEINYILNTTTVNEASFSRYFKEIFKNSSLGCAIISKNHSYKIVNKSFAKFLGLSVNSIEGREIKTITPVINDKYLEARDVLINQNKYSQTCFINDKQVTFLWCPLNANGFDQGLFLTVIMAEPINRRVSTSTKYIYKDNFDLIIKSHREAKIGMFVWNPKNNKLSFTEEFGSLHGLVNVGVSNNINVWYDTIHPEDQIRVKEQFDMNIHGRKSEIKPFTYRVLRPKNKITWIYLWGNNKTDTSGNIYEVVCFARDISQQKVIEEKYEESKHIMDTLMEYIPEGITISDAEKFKILMVSKYGENILGSEHEGMTVEDIVDKWKVFYPDGQTLVPRSELPLIKAISNNKVLRNIELIQKNEYGKKLFLSCNAGPIRSKRNKVIGGIVAWRDISDLKKAESLLKESEKRYRSLFEKMTEGFALHEIILDGKGRPIDYRFIEINPAFEKLTGLKRKDIINKVKTQVLPDDDPKWIEIYGKVALSGKPVHFENYSPALKRYFDVISYRPSINQFAVIFTDITERKATEQRKDDFISMASHELKTPLTSLKAFIQILNKKLEDISDNSVKEIIPRLDTQVNKLTNLVITMLDVTKIQMGKLIYQDDIFELDGMVDEVVNELKMAGLFENYKVRIIGATNKKICADKFRISQVLSNLLLNAVKYSSNSKNIEIILSVNKNKAIVSVKDYGIGIHKSELNKIFKRFYRVDPSHRVKGTLSSLGLGLYISKEIITRHKGKIWVESEYGTGSQFTFSLPFIKADN